MVSTTFQWSKELKDRVIAEGEAEGRTISGMLRVLAEEALSARHPAAKGGRREQQIDNIIKNINNLEDDNYGRRQ